VSHEQKNILILVTNNINPYMYDISQIFALPKGPYIALDIMNGGLKRKNYFISLSIYIV